MITGNFLQWDLNIEDNWKSSIAQKTFLTDNVNGSDVNKNATRIKKDLSSSSV